MKKKIFWIIGVIGGLAITLWLASIGSRQEGLGVFIDVVQEGDIQEHVSASGKIYPGMEVKISSDVSGEIIELYVAEGDSVKKGQLLLKINPDTYVAAVQRGEAALHSAMSQKAIAEAQYQTAVAQKEQVDAQVLNARQVFQRNKSLYQDKVISRLEYESSEATLLGLEANLRAAQASVKSAQSNIEAAVFAIKSAQATLNELKTSLQRTAIYAPNSGIVSRLSVSKGERVVGTIQMTGTELMRIANLDQMEVQIEVTESDILRLKVGQEAEIEVDAYFGRKFKGYVHQIANSATLPAGLSNQNLTADQISNFTVKVRLDPESYRDLMLNPLGPFRPGMSASVKIRTAEVQGVLIVPIQSVTTRETIRKDYKTDQETGLNKGHDSVAPASVMRNEVVFRYSEGKAFETIVVTGLQDEANLEIKQGLQKGDTVITGPFSILSKTLQDQNQVYIKSSITNKN